MISMQLITPLHFFFMNEEIIARFCPPERPRLLHTWLVFGCRIVEQQFVRACRLKVYVY